MKVIVNLDGVKAKVLADVVAEAAGEQGNVKYLARPYLGYVIGEGAADVTCKTPRDVIAKDFVFVSCKGELVISDVMVGSSWYDEIMYAIKANSFECELLEAPAEDSPAAPANGGDFSECVAPAIIDEYEVIEFPFNVFRDDLIGMMANALGEDPVCVASGIEFGKFMLPNKRAAIQVLDGALWQDFKALKSYLHDRGVEIKRVMEDSSFGEEAPAADVKVGAYVAKDNRYTVIADLLEGETREKFFNLVESKRELLCKALGVDYVPIIEDDVCMRLPWFENTNNIDDGIAYQLLVEKMLELARNGKRIGSKERPHPNPKYAFRCFLLRLGFIGKEYGYARKLLLSKLEGNGSWLNGAPEKEVAENV